MKRGRETAILMAALLCGGLAGWWLTRSARPAPAPPRAVAIAPAARPTDDPAPRAAKGTKREPGGKVRDAEAAEAGALENQRWLRFRDRAALDRFLAAAQGKGIAVLGSLDRLLALHVGFLSAADLAALLDGSEESGFIFPVSLPTPRTEGVQEGAVGFGDGLLSWLGVTGDHSAFGSGVKVAILDTGSTLPGAKNQFLVAPPDDPANWNGHGTAVADLIRQIAPSAELLSWRVANDDGQSNSFLLAQGILAALDAGVDIINISMGSYGNSGILRDAVELAQQAGVKIYASGGNEGYDHLAYPAAYAGVVGVGAVDANNSYLEFSNSGSVAMTAPGLDLLTAWTGGQSVYFTGTSASAPIGAAVLAATMSQGGTRLSANQAYDRVAENLNEAGAPGTDSYYGNGFVDLGRILRAGQAGITDAAIASNHVTTDVNGRSQVQVTVQNRGTTLLVNTPVEVTTPSGTTTMNITTLQPGDINTFTLPLSFSGESATIQSRVQVTGGGADFKPSNNRRTDVFIPAAND
jgi:uncharacterized membrane protein